MAAVNHCAECGLDYLYEPKFHKCHTKMQPGDYLGESWLEEIKRKQQLREWKEDRKR